MANTEASTGNMADFGGFVKDEEEELDLEELVEPWHRYERENQNVLYPIRLGEVLNKRYLVEHKLGFGEGSTVWMAFDLKDKKNVALKVMALGKWGDNEIRIQDEIIKTVRDTSRLVIYEATFSLFIDDKSCYRVLVFPMKGPSICTLTLKSIPMASRMSAARQLLETVAALHEAGIIHRVTRSALKTDNTVCRPLEKGELVSPIRFPEDLRTDEFYLCDFGLAKKIGDLSSQHGYPPMHYCSPDRLHKQEPSFACDSVELYGCFLYALPYISSVSHISRGWSCEWYGRMLRHPT
ncbi:hypothetical protein N7468_000714 [Penicillium chermesinum]|uniref:Protein kinase domain-containing protein n=1 Tax=Penicillium chermesinum TaxID=63820 RepID=A0A9W9PMI9_9EURO|nr:uncharacterized protein N7468_000714 [Penicillium chermesinum]KAJ5249263.1 hypothetical protein N7468_000714 [Penicillium chermesinum]